MKTQKHTSKWPTIITAVVAWGLLFAYLGHFGYHKYQDSQKPTVQTGTETLGNFGQNRAGGTGLVVSSNQNEITFNNHRSGKTETYKLSETTNITEEGKPRSCKDLKKGELVLIWTNSTDLTTAKLVVINPNMDGSAQGVRPE